MMRVMGGTRRALTAMWTIALLFAILAAAGLAGLDGMVKQRLPAADPTSLWNYGAALLDTAALRHLGDWVIPAVLFIAGLLLLPLRATRGIGYPLLYVGLVHLIAIGTAALARPFFGRVRPSEAASGGDPWFASGDAFPSDETAFHAGLFLPLVLLLPRGTPIWLAPPLFAAAAALLRGEHYLSDAAAPLALAAALAAGLAFLGEKGRE